MSEYRFEPSVVINNNIKSETNSMVRNLDFQKAIYRSSESGCYNDGAGAKYLCSRFL